MAQCKLRIPLHYNWSIDPKIVILIEVILDQLIIGGEEGLNVVDTPPFGLQVLILGNILSILIQFHFHVLLLYFSGSHGHCKMVLDALMSPVLV